MNYIESTTENTSLTFKENALIIVFAKSYTDSHYFNARRLLFLKELEVVKQLYLGILQGVESKATLKTFVFFNCFPESCLKKDSLVLPV